MEDHKKKFESENLLEEAKLIHTAYFNSFLCSGTHGMLFYLRTSSVHSNTYIQVPVDFAVTNQSWIISIRLLQPKTRMTREQQGVRDHDVP